MQEIINRALSFIIMLFLSYGLKRVGVFTKKDGVALSKLVMNLLLPCAIVNSFASSSFSLDMLSIILIGICVNCILLFFALLVSMRSSREDKIYYILSTPAFNIGNFTLPFTSGILGPVGALTTSLFDAGNALQCLGVDYLAAKAATQRSVKGKDILKLIFDMFKVPSFLTHVICLSMILIKLKFPTLLTTFTSIVGSANGAVSMFMIGILLEFNFDKKCIRKVIKLFAIRYSVAIVASLVLYNILPFEYIIKKSILILLFAPISTASVPFTLDLNGDLSLASMVNSISLVISIILIPILLIAI